MSFPEHWAQASGRDVFSLVTSGSRGWAQHYADEGAAFVRMGNLDHDTVNLDLKDLQRVAPPPGAEGARTRLQADDILISITAELGMVGLVPPTLGEAYINQHLALARPIAILEPRFLAWYLASAANGKGDLLKSTRGATKASLGLDDIRDLQIPLPPHEEQRRIADKLDALLARVEVCRERMDRVPGILKRFRQAVLTSALTGNLSHEWRRAQLGGSTEWQDTTIGDIAAVGTGSTPLRSNPAYFDSLGTPWVTSASTGAKYIEAAEEGVTPAAIHAHRLKVFPPNTLLVAMYGEGKTRGQVSELRIHATINQACAAIQVDVSKALKDFVKLALFAQYEEMRALAEGGNQPNLNLSKVKGLAIRLPSQPEQSEIVRRVESLFALADAIEARCTAARAQVERLTPALLAKAFRGELVAQDPNDEPAAVMLERIRAQGAASGMASQAGRRKKVDREKAKA